MADGPRPMTRITRIGRSGVIAALVIGAALGLAGYLVATRPGQSPVAPGERVWRVAVSSVEPGVVSPELVLYGQVKAREDSALAAPGAAQVTEVPVRAGDRVSQGDLLVALDPRDFEPAVRRAVAEVQDLEAQMALEQVKHKANTRALTSAEERVKIARSQVTRQRELKSKGLGSQQALDQAREALAQREQEWITRALEIESHEARLAQLRARLARARAALETARLALERSVLRAPFDGVVSEVDASPAEWVQTGRTLVRVYRWGSLEVHARVPEPYRRALMTALGAGHRLQAHSDAGVLALDRLAGEADPAGVTAVFAVSRGWSRYPGEVVELRLVLPPAEGAVALPAAALYGGDTIYRIDGGRLQRLRVEVVGHRRGPDGATEVVVRSPRLQRGDRVVVTHLPQAIDGLRVQVAQAPSEGGGEAPW